MARRAVRTREDIEITEGAIDTLKKIVANKQNMPVKFTDGSMKIDLFTASAITKVYDAVNDANKEKLERMMQTKAGMLRVQDFAMDQIKTESAEEIGKIKDRSVDIHEDEKDDARVMQEQ